MSEVHEIDERHRVELARTVLQILNDWGVRPEQQVTLLGLPTDTRPRSLNRFRSGTPLPNDHACLLRARHILSIQNAVESMYPHNTTVGNYWVSTPNAFFSNKTPIEIMLSHELEGMERLVHHLNGTGAWG